MKSARSLRGLLVVFVLAGLLIGAAGAEAKPHKAKACLPGQPQGSPGIGDEYYPTYGNGGYDVQRYLLDVAYDPATDVLDGKATIRARATQSVCSFNLDFVGLEISKITVDGHKATWTRDDHELTVTPKTPLERGKRFEVFVRYSGVPVEFVLPGFGIRTGFMAVDDGVTVAGQPEVAAAWYPVNDHPLDKAAYRFEVTVPRGYEVAANGCLRDVDERGGRSTWEWVAREPMASYLATIDIGFWDVNRWRTDDGLPVYDAVDSALTGDLRAAIDSSLARQGEVLDVLEGAFGPYPFSTVGAIVDNQDDLFFALETQTRPCTRSCSGSTRRATSSTATASSSTSSPTSGSATTSPSPAGRTSGSTRASRPTPSGCGPSTRARGRRRRSSAPPMRSIPADDPFWATVIGDPGIDLLFDNAVYVRGAMTLQALREEVGDDAFFEIVKQWASSKSGGNGTTPQFIALAEQVSGMQLDELFDTWLFTGERPVLEDPAATGARAQSARSYSAGWLDQVQARLARGRY